MVEYNREFTYLDVAEYEACVITSYTGGSTWLRDSLGRVLVAHGISPVQIAEEFKTQDTLRVEVWHGHSSQS